MEISTGSNLFIAGAPFNANGFELNHVHDCELRVFISPVQMVVVIIGGERQLEYLQPFQPASLVVKKLEFIQSVLFNNEYLKKNFRKKTVSILTQDFIVAPKEIANETFSEKWKSRFSNNVDSFLCHDIFKADGAEIIYAIDTDFKKSLDKILTDYSLNHALSGEIEFLVSKNSERKIYCIVHTGYMQVLLLNNKQVEFVNVFYYNSPDDFIYFILAVYKYWDLNPEVDPLVLLGEVVKDSSMYHFVYKYIRNVEFGRFNNEISFPKDYPFPPHFYFSLIT